MAEMRQVWPLTQLYSVDFSQSRIGVKKCVFNKRTIKVCVSFLWGCLGTFSTTAAHLTRPCILACSGSNAEGESRVLEGRHVSSKTPSRVRDGGDEGVAWRKEREYSFLDEDDWFALQANQRFLTKRKQNETELVARPDKNKCFAYMKRLYESEVPFVAFPQVHWQEDWLSGCHAPLRRRKGS